MSFFSIEQPVTSNFKHHPAFQSLTERVCLIRLCTHLGAFDKKMTFSPKQCTCLLALRANATPDGTETGRQSTSKLGGSSNSGGTRALPDSSGGGHDCAARDSNALLASRQASQAYRE